MEENIEVLKKELERKEKIFEEKYVLNMKENDYLSEEAEKMRKEIRQLRSKIREIKDNASCNKEDIKILEDFINHIRFNGPMNYGISLYYKAIENLIKGYRELEKENKKLNNSNKTYINCIQSITPVLMADYIEKSKVLSIMRDIQERTEKLIDTTYVPASFRIYNDNREKYEPVLKGREIAIECLKSLQELMEDK